MRHYKIDYSFDHDAHYECGGSGPTPTTTTPTPTTPLTGSGSTCGCSYRTATILETKMAMESKLEIASIGLLPTWKRLKFGHVGLYVEMNFLRFVVTVLILVNAASHQYWNHGLDRYGYFDNVSSVISREAQNHT